MSNIFTICEPEKLKQRFLTVLQVAPEIFLCGFLWSGFSVACDCGTETTSFYFMSGFGSGLGALFGHILTHITFENGMPTVERQELFHACAYFCAIFFGSGTTWQRIVNDTIRYNMTFTESFFYMWLLSTLMFLTVLTVMRFLNTQYTKSQFSKVLQIEDDFMDVQHRFFFDIQLACVIGFADAFFVGTVTGEYTNNWLGPAFGVHEYTSTFVGMCKSGGSTLVGFVILQSVLNVIMKDCWLDPVEVVYADRQKSEASGGVVLKDVGVSVNSPIQNAV